MRLGTLRRSRQHGLPGLFGVARLDQRTKDLTRRIKPGEIAVINHVDIDRVAAEALVGCDVGAVVNAAASTSGRYPNLGPEIIVSAGIPLLDDVGPEVFEAIRDGDRVRLDGETLYLGEHPVAKGTLLTPELVTASLGEARASLSAQLEAFAGNTMEFLKRERDLLLDGVGVPAVRTKIAGRHCLVVVRGYHYREDLAVLRSYIREYRPVLIGVDGGADALIECGYKPHLIVGDMDSVSDAALTSGAEVVVHAYRDGRAPGLQRVHDLGVDPVVFPAAGTSEDIALLLADERGASLIVAVGTHATLVEFLDKGRAGMASTFLTRLRVGSKLIDAKGVSRLYRSRIGAPSLLLLVVAVLLALTAMIAVSPLAHAYASVVASKWDAIVFWFREHLTS